MTPDVYAGLFTDDLDSVAERRDAAAAQSSADSLRTGDVLSFAEARTKRASQGADLRKDIVGPVGLEPTTYGLKELPIPVQNVGDLPFRAWFLEAG
jgi:hypothetical protein